MFGAVKFLNVLILTLLCVQLFILVKLIKLPPVWKRAANSAYHLLFRCLLRLFIFPFDVWDKLWILIRPDPEVSLLV